MLYVYHLCPSALKGDILYPLSRLAMLYPEIAAEAFKKYIGREKITQVQIPYLELSWIDVVHLAPIHPQIVRMALESCGVVTRDRLWLEIPVENLDAVQCVYYENAPVRDGASYIFPPTCFKPFDLDNYVGLTQIPEHTLAYYKEFVAPQTPLLFNGVRHVLAGGAVPLKNAREILW